MDSTQAPPESTGRVLVIGGWGRCGSTLVDMMLGQVPGFVSAGEVRELWLRGILENRPCGCGVSFRCCPFWTKIGDEAFGGWDAVDLGAMLRVRYAVDRPWGAPRLLRARRRGVNPRDIQTYADALVRLYAAIRAVSGASVVVDSSKLATHTMVLQCIPGLDLRLVHLVRDSRGVAYSNQKVVIKAVTSGPPTFLPRNGAVAASARYALYNGATGALAHSGLPYLRLRYEDFVEAPERQLRALLDFSGRPSDVELPFLRDGDVVLGESHLVDGNPVRFRQGPIQVRLDDEWRDRLPARDRVLVGALTSPMLLAYGYRVRRG
jgi:hypothetical protein